MSDPSTDPTDDSLAEEVTEDAAESAGAPAVGGDEQVLASEVVPGDVLRSRDGTEFTVTRVEDFGMFGPPLLAFIEDTSQKWFKMPSARDAEVTRVRRAGA